MLRFFFNKTRVQKMHKYIKLTTYLFIFFIGYGSFGFELNNNFTQDENKKKPTNQEFCRLILKKYEQKDLEGFNQMFAENVVIRDWKIRVEGKTLALNEFKKNFESVNSLKIDILAMYENNNTVAAELKITIDEKQIIYIIDVITLTQDQKIGSIRSYIGRGDQD